MTRKRFVKLLMGRGYSRNDANLMAQEVVNNELSYEDGYFAAKVNDGDSEAMEKIWEVVGLINEIIPTVVEAVNAAIPEMARQWIELL